MRILVRAVDARRSGALSNTRSERNRPMTHLSNRFPRNRLFALSDFYYS